MPFAIEDRLCAPLGTLHLVLGPEVAPRSHVAAVVGHAVMTEWTAALAAAGLGDAAIVPDALLLPRPTTGSWRVERRGNRVIVRTDDGGGFAVSNDRFAEMWTRGGRLPCLVRGDAPEGLPTDSVAVDAATAVVGIPLDLRAGRYAVPMPGRGGAAWRAGAIVAVGMLAHTAIAAVDTVGVHGAVVAETAAPAARRTGFLRPTILRDRAGVVAAAAAKYERLRAREAGDPTRSLLLSPPGPRLPLEIKGIY